MRTILLLALFAVWPALAAAADRPNIILILGDDLGRGDLGCYGQTKILTPRIDALAAEGIRFTQAYSGSTVCAPSRCSLMTGRHNGRNRIRDNVPHGITLRPDDITVAEVLKQSGYRTGAIGKWSLGDAGTPGVPNAQGFDYWFGELNQELVWNYYPASLWENDRIVLLTETVTVGGVNRTRANRGGARAVYSPDQFDAKAQAFIRENRERPFFLYLATSLPHFSDYPGNTPEHFMVPDDAPYGNRDWPQAAKNYAAMVTRFDRTVGGIVDLLRELGLEGNTLVIVTSDNGPYHHPIPIDFFRSNGALRGKKRDLYEGGIRVPLIARWPARIRPGRVSDHVTAGWDFLPTFAELAGVPVPPGVDGISIGPVLAGADAAQRSPAYLYWDYGHARPAFSQAVRLGNWKGVRLRDAGPIQLFDLAKDESETADVSAAHPEIVQRIAGIVATALVPSPDYPIVSRTAAGASLPKP
jgi:arylsulfatase A-like enzyme